MNVTAENKFFKMFWRSFFKDADLILRDLESKKEVLDSKEQKFITYFGIDNSKKFVNYFVA